MTMAALKREIGKLSPAEQARLLSELATELERALANEDKMDRAVFQRRRREEVKARPWSQVESSLPSRSARRR